MLPTFHCGAPGCESTCDLSSRDRDRVPAALKERGWSVTGDKKYHKYLCPTHTPHPNGDETEYAEPRT